MFVGVGPQPRVPRVVPTLPGSGAPADFIYVTGTDAAYIANNAGAYQILDTGTITPTPPGGSNTQVQFNNSGAFGGVAGFTWVAPTLMLAGATTTGPDVEVKITGDTNSRVALGVNTSDIARVSFGPGNAVRDLFLERLGAASLRFGAPDAAAPVAQTLSVQNVVAGTADTAGANLTIKGSQGTGTGVGGSIILQTAPAGSTASTQNALVNAAVLNSAGQLSIGFGATTPVSGPMLAVASTISTSPRGILSAQFSTDTAGARVGFQKARGTVASPTTVVTGDTLGRLMFRGYDGTNYLEMGSIEIAANGTIGTAQVPTQMILSTATNANPSVLTTALTLGNDQSATFAGTVNGINASFAPTNTTGNGFAIAGSTTSSGNLVSIAASGTAAASNTKIALNVATSGANATNTQTTFAIKAANSSTGTASTNVGLYAPASGGTTNIGVDAVASGGTTNHAIRTEGGNVDFGAAASQTTNVFQNGTYFVGGNSTTAASYLFAFGPTSMVGRSSYSYGFASSDVQGSLTADTNISRNTAGVVQIGTTTTNALGSIMAVNFTSTGTFSTSSTTDATTTTSGALQVAGGAAIRKRVFIDGISASAGLQTAVLCQSSGGEMIADSVACLASSERYKEGIEPLKQGLDEVMALRPVTYRYKREGIFTQNKAYLRERVGLIAEDVAKVDSRVVGFEADGVTPRTVGYEMLVPLLVKAIQDQQHEIEVLNLRLETVNKKLSNH